MEEKIIDIGISLPPFVRVVEIDNLVVVKNWEDVPLAIFHKELLPLDEHMEQMIREKITEEEVLFLKLFSY